MKIGLFISVAGIENGGLQVLALRLAKNLKKYGHEVRIIARFTGTNIENYLRLETPRIFTTEGVEVEIVSLRGWRRWLLLPVRRLHERQRFFPLAVALYKAAFRRELKRATQGSDLIHFLGLGVELLGYAACADARKMEIPFVVEPAMHVGRSGDGHADWPLYQRADMVIAHTEFEAECLRQNGVKASHVHAVRHGFDALEPGDGARFRKAHGIEGRMILFVGRRCEEKGYFSMLEAFALLRKQLPDVTLVIAGPGETERSTAEGVLELGRIPEQTRQDALSACTVFCVPSKGESFGMAYFEAWACGKPVVALDLPVLRETIGASGGGLLAAPDETEDLVEKLRHLLEHPELGAETGARGKEFSKGYSWDVATTGYLEAYAKAQENQRSPS